MLLAKIHVAIIGGGFSGVMTTVNLLKCNIPGLQVTIIEPKPKLGLGLAYSTSCKQHLLNVPTLGMSALAEDPTHFLNYARSLDATVPEYSFLPRKFYGEYIGWLLESELSRVAELHLQVSVKHVQSEVIDIEKKQASYELLLLDGASVVADVVVLALGNLAGKMPAWLNGLDPNCKNYIHNPWKTEAIESIASDQSVLLVGTGLTAVDKIIELRGRGHTGTIYALSRHGLLPRSHRLQSSRSPVKVKLDGQSSLSLLKTMRKQISSLETNASLGTNTESADWRQIVDGLRSTTQAMWRSLPLLEQKRFLRHLQTYWDVHRHRMAPEIGAKIEMIAQANHLQSIAGKLVSIQEHEGALSVEIKERARAKTLQLTVGKILNCTGPQSSLKIVDSQLLKNLLKRKLICQHALGNGISTSADGKIRDEAGCPVEGLFAIGPLLKAELFESVAVPELKEQAANLASIIAGHSRHA